MEESFWISEGVVSLESLATVMISAVLARVILKLIHAPLTEHK
jgi:hypothetical protein